MAYDYDMIVIGGGAAGLTGAGMSAVLGAKTLLVEAEKPGGDCTWHGCVPSKTLIRAAKAAHEMRQAALFGLTPSDPAPDFGKAMARVHSIRRQIYEEADAPPVLERLGVEVRKGRARFADPHTIEVDGRARVSSRYFLIATGSSPRLPPFARKPGVLTNETLFEIDRLPRRLTILGSGPVGIEMAQAFRRLGSEVTVISRSPRILRRDDPEHTSELQRILEGEGIRFVLGHEADRVEGDRVLAALGREPNIASLHCAAAGVAFTDQGITVDRHCRTSVKHIYASGDVTGRYQLTHMAEHMSKVAVLNAILRVPSSIDERHVNWCTFTDPELAHTGATEEQLKARGARYSAHRFPFRRLDRAIADSATAGMVKVLATRWGRILGVSILGAHAGEMIGEYALAMRNGIRLSGVSSTIHPYPTYGLGNRLAADTFMMSLLTPRLAGWIRRLFGLRGRVDGIAAMTER